MEEQIKKIYEKQKNGRIRMIRNVLLIYVALLMENYRKQKNIQRMNGKEKKRDVPGSRL